MQNETFESIDEAVSGDKEALQSILVSVQDMMAVTSVVLGTIISVAGHFVL